MRRGREIARFARNDGVLGSEAGGCGDSGRVREGLCGLEHVVPLIERVAEFEFGFDDGNGAEHDAADACESIGITNGNAILGDGGVKAAHGVVDVGSGHEIT